MTHEDFKERMLFSMTYSKYDINRFLDGLLEDTALEQLFETWRQGKLKKLEKDIEALNMQRENDLKNENYDIPPRDKDLPQKEDNGNSKVKSKK